MPHTPRVMEGAGGGEERARCARLALCGACVLCAVPSCVATYRVPVLDGTGFEDKYSRIELSGTFELQSSINNHLHLQTPR